MPETRLVYVADREGDLRALINAAARRGTPADWLIRSKHNRKTTTGEKLGAAGPERPVGGGRIRPAGGTDRPARSVRQTLYRTVVTLPAHHGQPAVTVTAILAREEQPPAGEKAIEWRLLTNRTAETLEAVVELIDGYRKRWLIEIFFRIWKSGCRVEALQLGTLERLERALVLYLIIAWRILHLVTWGRDCPNLPCDVVFDPEEWQAAWIVAHRTQPPETPPPLGQMVRLIARLGAFWGANTTVIPVLKPSGKACRRSERLSSRWRPAVPCMPVTDKLWVIGWSKPPHRSCGDCPGVRPVEPGPAHMPVGDESVLQPLRVLPDGLEKFFQHDPAGLLRGDPAITAAACHSVGHGQQNLVRRQERGGDRQHRDLVNRAVDQDAILLLAADPALVHGVGNG